MIDKCSFGKMVIGGRPYDSDLWIYPDRRIQDSWWRTRGHRLEMSDIDALIATRPEILVVGTGIFGRMRLAEDIADGLKNLGIELREDRTKSAAKIYNQLQAQEKRVAACFHLTC